MKALDLIIKGFNAVVEFFGINRIVKVVNSAYEKMPERSMDYILILVLFFILIVYLLGNL